VPRPDQSQERREEYLPLIAGAFARLGYRGATTALLAESCGVRENILYRLWPDKRAMFVASLEHVYQKSEDTWLELLAGGGEGSSAQRLLEHEASHLGERGLHRLVFTALGETDDPEIREALSGMYLRFVTFIQEQVARHRGVEEGSEETALTAWAILGLGTVANIGRELGLLDEERRRRLMIERGGELLGG